MSKIISFPNTNCLGVASKVAYYTLRTAQPIQAKISSNESFGSKSKVFKLKHLFILLIIRCVFNDTIHL